MMKLLAISLKYKIIIAFVALAIGSAFLYVKLQRKEAVEDFKNQAILEGLKQDAEDRKIADENRTETSTLTTEQLINDGEYWLLDEDDSDD